MKKLTYYQICNLIHQGRENEIPSGYKIVWTTPEPCKMFEVELPGERITTNGNCVPKPIKAYVSGAYEVIMPLAVVSDNDVLDFRTIDLRTKLSLTKLKFEYEHQHDILTWVYRMYSGYGQVNISDCAVNITMKIKDTTLNLNTINVFKALPIPGLIKDNTVELDYNWAEFILN